MRTLYDVLGVQPDVDNQTIKLAFRALAKAWHPDTGDRDRRSEQWFKQVTAAYVTLRDPVSRAAYDKNLDAARRRRRAWWRRELIFCTIAAVLSFTATAGFLLYGREPIGVDEPARRAQAPLQDRGMQDRGLSGAIDDETQALVRFSRLLPGMDEAGILNERPPDREATVLPYSARHAATVDDVVMDPGEVARPSPEIAADRAAVRVRTGRVVRTFQVPREPAGAAAGERAQIHVWSAHQSGRAGASRSYRLRLFTIKNERPAAEGIDRAPSASPSR
jgi:hypothetical protein